MIHSVIIELSIFEYIYNFKQYNCYYIIINKLVLNNSNISGGFYFTIICLSKSVLLLVTYSSFNCITFILNYYNILTVIVLILIV